MTRRRSALPTALQSVAATVTAVLTAVGCSAQASPSGGGPGGSPQEGPAESNGSPGGSPPMFTASELAALAALSPDTLPGAPPDKTNAHADDANAAALGQRFFFDTGLSGKLLETGPLGSKGQAGLVTCVSCHDPAAGFSDDRSPGMQISLGAAWGRRVARSLLDVGQAKLLGWDGRHDALYNIGVGALESPTDMNSARLYVAEQIYARYKTAYEAIFGPLPSLDDGARFPALTADQIGCQTSVAFTPSPGCTQIPHGVPGDSAEFDKMSYADQQAVTGVAVNVGKALGAYMRLLTSGPSRFDAWVHGQGDALSASEQRGAQLFIGKGHCTGCHSGPFFSDGAPHDVGLAPAAVSPSAFVDANDQGASIGIA
jgi:cytochrome c peroxidase